MPLAAKITIAVIVFVVAALIGFDIVMATNHVPNALDTLSGRMRIWAFETPFISWSWAGLSGHFFGCFHKNQFIPYIPGILLLVLLSCLVIIGGMILKSKGITIHPAIICPIAFLLWSILFAQ